LSVLAWSACTPAAWSALVINESFIGSVFEGRVLSETRVGDNAAVVPEIRGRAFICRFANWVLDDRDPLTGGFSVTR
jgi:proline racemase